MFNDSALHIKNTVLAVLAATGSAIAQALGGWDVALKVLICFMALDYATGWLVAAIWHKSALQNPQRHPPLNCTKTSRNCNSCTDADKLCASGT